MRLRYQIAIWNKLDLKSRLVLNLDLKFYVTINWKTAKNSTLSDEQANNFIQTLK